MAWFQILIRAHKKEQIKKGTLFEKTDAWQDKAKEEMRRLGRRRRQSLTTTLNLWHFQTQRKVRLKKLPLWREAFPNWALIAVCGQCILPRKKILNP